MSIKRIWELDFLRGIALFGMLYFHLIFDLNEFFDYPITYAHGFTHYAGKVSVILFILVSGISCRFSRNNLRRGLQLLGIALIITMLTHSVNYLGLRLIHQPLPNIGIKFGILHFFGVSILLYPVFKTINRYALAILGSLIIGLGELISARTFSHNYFFFLGMINEKFYSVDYYPLLPWLGVFLIGIVLGKFLYQEKKSLFPFTIRNSMINILGRNTLLIYLIHQPVLLLILFVCLHL
ncbi:MAG: heparan-alpha-glucosaminide N-acetyltransferase [Bacillota bacterium]|jgi:uncharacterized membrane protein